MIQAKKSLGQNFLKSKRALDKIVEVSDLSQDDLVLEVGPGKGALTKKILETGAKVLVIEKDHRMIPVLEEVFFVEIKKGQLEIFEGDALEIDYQKLGLKKGNFKLIANLPYYITGKFLSNVLSHEIQPSVLVLMLQKAVVERITLSARSSQKERENFKENLLSLSVKVYGHPEYVMSVSAKNFSPAPKVDSAVLKVSDISKEFFVENNIDEKEFFIFLKAAFSSKRKKMIKNLVTQKISDRKKLENVFGGLKISVDVRAEDLNLENFKNIFIAIQ